MQQTNHLYTILIASLQHRCHGYLSLEVLRDSHEDPGEQQILNLAEVKHGCRIKALATTEALAESQAEAAKDGEGSRWGILASICPRPILG